MKLVFVSSPLRGNLKENIEKAKKFCHWVTKQGYAVFAPHVFFTQFLDDSKEDERAIGLQSGLEFLERCDEFWYFTDEDCKLSEGMMAEYKRAVELGKPVHHVKFLDITEDQDAR